MMTLIVTKVNIESNITVMQSNVIAHLWLGSYKSGAVINCLTPSYHTIIKMFNLPSEGKHL